MGVLPDAPTACVVHVAAAGGPGTRCITRASATCVACVVAGGTGGRCIAGPPAATVVGGAGGAGGQRVAGSCIRSGAPCLIVKTAAAGVAGSDTVTVATSGGSGSHA